AHERRLDQGGGGDDPIAGPLPPGREQVTAEGGQAQADRGDAGPVAEPLVQGQPFRRHSRTTTSRVKETRSAESRPPTAAPTSCSTGPIGRSPTTTPTSMRR